MAKSRERETAKATAKKPAKGRSAVGARSGKRSPGQPAKYTEPATMADKIKRYFDDLKGPPTMAGLALALGFADRQSLIDYSERSEEFSCVIKNARVRIEAFHEARLATQSPTGSIFWLKNHARYSDRTELTGANGGPLEVITLTPAERAARIAEILAKAGG